MKMGIERALVARIPEISEVVSGHVNDPTGFNDILILMQIVNGTSDPLTRNDIQI